MTGEGMFVAGLYAAALVAAGGVAWRWWRRSAGAIRAGAAVWLAGAFGVPGLAALVEVDAWPGREPEPYVMLVWWWLFAVVATGAAWWLWWAGAIRRA